MTEKPDSGDVPAPMLGMAQVKKILAVKSDATVRAMVRDGTFPPPIKVRNTYRWPAQVVRDWEAQQVREALEQQAAGVVML